MNKKTALFCILTISMLILPSLLGVAIAGKVKTRSAYATMYAPPDTPYFQLNVHNNGDVTIVSVIIGVAGAGVSSWGPLPGWTYYVNAGYEGVFTASGRAVIRSGGAGAFQFNLDDLTSPIVVTWTAYDRKGTLVDTGTINWNPP